ncbi:MAG: hypothetical protein M5R36_04260 [Deltaproteobacteria bacterium]|nr:hypothetical protein [Deltaproteobacteria bacterium]
MKKIADGDRVIEADFVEAGLDAKEEYLAYEFWTESYLGKFAGAVSLDVPAHEPRVVALRPDLGRPQFLGTNRHILGGVRVVENLAWNADAKTLTGTQEASVGTTHAPFAFHLAFFVPDGYAFDDVAFQTESDIDVTNESTSETPVDGGSVLDVYFELEDTDGPDMGGLFGEMTWTLSFE